MQDTTMETNGIKTKSYTIANVDNEPPTFEAYYKNDERLLYCFCK